MPDASFEIMYTGSAKPLSWGERLIREHTPEAHYQDIMKKYFRVTDRLEGKPREIAQRLRPQVELAAKAAGWSETFVELYVAGSALALTTIIAGKGLKTAAEVFGGMGRKHEPNTPIRLIGPPEKSVQEATEAFGADSEVATAAQLLIEHMTSKQRREID